MNIAPVIPTRFNRLRIDNSNYIHYEVAIVDRGASDLIFTSMVGSDVLLKNIGKMIKKKANCYLESQCHCTIQGKFNIEREKQSNSDFSHMVLRKEDIIEKNNDTDEEFYIFYNVYRSPEELKDILYDKLYNNTSVPILESWMDFIINNFEVSGQMSDLRVFSANADIGISASKVIITKSALLSLVQNGLRSKLIQIENIEVPSNTMNEVNGLDMYLNVYGDLLANKIQEAFVPKFDPQDSNNNKYTEYVNNYDDSCHYNGIEIYEAQKAVIQAAVNNLEKNKTTFVIGEMGVGRVRFAV